MKSSELIRLLLKDGWIIKSHKGSHLKMVHHQKKGKLVVPNHGSREVGSGLCKKILKDADIR
ncbi:MAG: type II toxin-antitoxin system HicA family toxin [Bacteroidales bacterium]|nr:type II toxin-antitoxin system HicA family toxin [Bacteroidales bacterium]